MAFETNAIYRLCVELKRMDPDSRQSGIAANAVLPAVMQRGSRDVVVLVVR
jgi:hypothetical protein